MMINKIDNVLSKIFEKNDSTKNNEKKNKK